MSTTASIEPVSGLPITDRRLLVWMRDHSVIGIVAALFVAMSLTAPHFLSVTNLINILDQNAPLMLVALGMTFVMIAGAFDLSSGQVVSMSGVFGAFFAAHLDNAILGILLGIAIGAPAGLINATLVGWLRVNSFLATLATGLIFGGIALMLTNGSSIDLSSNPQYTWLGTHYFGRIPAAVVLTVLVLGVLWALLSLTVIGRQVYAVGSNREAARLSGLSVPRVMIFVFVIGGLSAAAGGLLVSTQTGVGNTYGPANTMTLQAIAAVVIGGTSITGGRGSVWRTVFGVLLLALVQNALDLLSLPPYWQQIVSGSIIVIAIVLNTFSSRVSA